MRIQCKLYEMLFRLGFNNKLTAIVALRKGFSQGNIKIVGQGAEYGMVFMRAAVSAVDAGCFVPFCPTTTH